MPGFIHNNPLILRDWRDLKRNWHRKPFTWLVIAIALIQSVVFGQFDRLFPGTDQFELILLYIWGLAILVHVIVPLGAIRLPHSRALAPLIEECLQTPMPHLHIASWLFFRAFNSTIAVALALFLPIYLCDYDARNIVLTPEPVFLPWIRPAAPEWCIASSHIAVITIGVLTTYGAWRGATLLAFTTRLSARFFGLLLLLIPMALVTGSSFNPQLGPAGYGIHVFFPLFGIIWQFLFSAGFGTALGLWAGLTRERGAAKLIVLASIAAELAAWCLYLAWQSWFGTTNFDSGNPMLVSIFFPTSRLAFYWLIAKWAIILRLSHSRISME